MEKNIEIYDSNIFVRIALNLSDFKHNTWLYGLEHRLIYSLDADLVIWVSNNKITMNKHDILIISAGIPYKIISSKGNILFFYFDLTSENTNIPRIFPCSKQDFSINKLICKYKLLYNGKTFDYIVFKNVIGVSEFLNKICRTNDKTDKLSQKYKSSLLTATITTAFYQQENDDKVKNPLGLKVKKFIEENYNKNIKISDAALIFNYHESYINRQIKKQTGFAFHQYLLKIRLGKAMDILNTQYDISIERVSELVGFSDSKYFSIRFKKQFRISPSKVKNLL